MKKRYPISGKERSKMPKLGKKEKTPANFGPIAGVPPYTTTMMLKGTTVTLHTTDAAGKLVGSRVRTFNTVEEAKAHRDMLDTSAASIPGIEPMGRKIDLVQ